ncbi:MAG: hypothetical protein ACLGH0_11060 [Thermoanaerobaculia bacterium]
MARDYKNLDQEIAESNARVVIGYPWWLRPFLMRDVIGITLGHTVYLQRAMPPEKYEPLVRHELAHVRQVDRLGLLRFYWRYGTEFARHAMRTRSINEAYSLISFEIEAVAAERGYHLPDGQSPP